MELPNSDKFDGLSMFITIFPGKTIFLAAKSHVSRNYLGSNPRYIFFRQSFFWLRKWPGFKKEGPKTLGWVKNL
jgi:hypothetical protein